MQTKTLDSHMVIMRVKLAEMRKARQRLLKQSEKTLKSINDALAILKG